jgi:hypothetical protein
MSSEIDLIKLQAGLADVEHELRQPNRRGTHKPGALLKRQKFLEREKRIYHLAIELFNQRALVQSLEQKYEHSKTPEAKRLAKAICRGRLRKAKEREQLIAQGRAMGSGTLGNWRPSEAMPTKIPLFEDPKVRFLAALNSARRQSEDLEIELRSLLTNDQEWRGLVSLGLDETNLSRRSGFPTQIAEHSESVKNHQATSQTRRPGRPRKDAERARIHELRDGGQSWQGVANKINSETGQLKSKEAYRRLARSAKTK